MFAALSGWEIASLIAKFLWYFSALSLAGGIFSLWLIADSSRKFLVSNLLYMLSGAVIGFQGVVIYFLVQVGTAVDNGVAGMFDWSMVSFFLGTSIGEATLVRLAILLAIIIGLLATLTYLGRLQKPPSQLFFRLLLRFNAACLFGILLSFQLTGHLAPMNLLPRFALVVHVLAISLWIGTLYPLRCVTLDYEIDQIQFIMKKFGKLASYIVAALLGSALVMIIQLLTTPSELINSAYGLVLLAKISFVLGLLGLAALNRWRLVPALSQDGVVKQLRNSISVEIAVAFVVIALTVYLSTVVGPATM